MASISRVPAPRFTRLGLGPDESPTAEHLAHRIGEVLKSFSAHGFLVCELRAEIAIVAGDPPGE